MLHRPQPVWRRQNSRRSPAPPPARRGMGQGFFSWLFFNDLDFDLVAVRRAKCHRKLAQECGALLLESGVGNRTAHDEPCQLREHHRKSSATAWSASRGAGRTRRKSGRAPGAGGRAPARAPSPRAGSFRQSSCVRCLAMPPIEQVNPDGVVARGLEPKGEAFRRVARQRFRHACRSAIFRRNTSRNKCSLLPK